MPRAPKTEDVAASGTKVSAVLPAPLVALVDELATRENRSRSNAIVTLLQRALEATKPAAAAPAA